MLINKEAEYQVGDFVFRNFIQLSREELLMILRERNHPSVKQWMITYDDISVCAHLKFVDSLVNREDAFYWLIEYNSVPVGVLSLTHCNYITNEAEAGYYLFSSHQNAGIGLELQYSYKKLFFETFNVNNLPGEILWGNTNAYLISSFLGAKADGTIIKDGRKYIQMHTSKHDFESVGVKKLTSQFIKYIKANPIIWE